MNSTTLTRSSTTNPTLYADSLGYKYISTVNKEQRKRKGQYLTPVPVAEFMAKLAKPQKRKLRILDPGAGAGVLSCALCEHLALRFPSVNQIELVTYEIDTGLLPYLKSSLSNLKCWLQTNHKINFSFQIFTNDFILDNATALDGVAHNKFDLVISNPPYFKIPKSDPRAQAAASVVHGQPNIYALFMAVSSSILEENGELIFITPRSYTAGPYFRQFRERFLSKVRPVFFHLFGSRQEAFNRDAILQENVIIKAIKDENWTNKNHYVKLSFSNGTEDLNSPSQRIIKLHDILNMNSNHKIIHLPTNEEEENVIKLVQSWKYTLGDYNMRISTGPVVPFRAKEFIDVPNSNTKQTAPLLWMQHVKPMVLTWPLEMRKQQEILVNEKSMSILLPNKNYVILRRFSAKEEKRRLTAAPYVAKNFKTYFIGLENHLNYIYRPNGTLSLEEIYGLSAFFNCSLIDKYFRTFNGNTQVSATEIKNMPMPPLQTITAIGQYILSNPAIDNEQIDAFVVEFLLR